MKRTLRDLWLPFACVFALLAAAGDLLHGVAAMSQILTSLAVFGAGAVITGVTYLLQRTGHCCPGCRGRR